MKRLISLLLALVMICAVAPMAVSAASFTDYVSFEQIGPDKWIAVKPDGTQDTYTSAEIHKLYLDYAASQEAPVTHGPNDHEYSRNWNTAYHWYECECGAKIGVEHHVDPLDTTDDYCTCGYHFSDNADLVTLWVKGCPPIKGFDKNDTEYELTAYSYKDVKKIRIATRTFDSQATVELPDDLTLKEGKNTFEVKVTAENKKVTKTYTLTIIKEAR